jgi:hypothetical protein
MQMKRERARIQHARHKLETILRKVVVRKVIEIANVLFSVFLDFEIAAKPARIKQKT